MSNDRSRHSEPGLREADVRPYPSRLNRCYWHLRLLHERLERIVQSDLLPPGETVLDYGCGNQPYRSLFQVKFKHYIGADLPGSEHADLVINAGGTLPCDKGSIDCVLSSQVLEHTESPRAYLGEAHRVLKTGGSLVLSAPAVWVYHPHPIDYWRWTIEGLQCELRTVGFYPIMLQGVFGPESCALQLWQDGTFERLPHWMQPLYTWSIQSLIGLIERRRAHKLSNDASVYVILARKVSE